MGRVKTRPRNAGTSDSSIVTEIMAAQPEILAYANHVADRFDLREAIDFDTRDGEGTTFYVELPLY